MSIEFSVASTRNQLPCHYGVEIVKDARAHAHWDITCSFRLGTGARIVRVRAQLFKWLDDNAPGWSWRAVIDPGEITILIILADEIEQLAYMMKFGDEM